MSIVTETRYINYGESANTLNINCEEHLEHPLKKRNWGYVNYNDDSDSKVLTLSTPEFSNYWLYYKSNNSISNAKIIDSQYHDKTIRCFVKQEYLDPDWVHPKQFKISVKNIPFFEQLHLLWQNWGILFTAVSFVAFVTFITICYMILYCCKDKNSKPRENRSNSSSSSSSHRRKSYQSGLPINNNNFYDDTIPVIAPEISPNNDTIPHINIIPNSVPGSKINSRRPSVQVSRQGSYRNSRRNSNHSFAGDNNSSVLLFKKIVKSNFQENYNIKDKKLALDLFFNIDTVPNETFKEPIKTEYNSTAEYANSLLSAFARSINIQLSLKEEQVLKRQQEMVIKNSQLSVWFEAFKNQTFVKKLSNSPEKLFADMLLSTPKKISVELEEKLVEYKANWSDVREMRERFFEELPYRLVLLSLSKFYNVNIALVSSVGKSYKMLDKMEVPNPLSIVFIKSTSRRNTYQGLGNLVMNDEMKNEIPNEKNVTCTRPQFLETPKSEYGQYLKPIKAARLENTSSLKRSNSTTKKNSGNTLTTMSDSVNLENSCPDIQVTANSVEMTPATIKHVKIDVADVGIN